MKAALFEGAREIRVKDVPEPKLEPGAVVVKVAACGICGSDLHIYRQGSPAGLIMGHEFSGIVAAVGAGVTGVKEGNRVTAMSGRGCGQCYWCKQGDFLRCRNLQLLGISFPGAFAEYVLVPNFRLGQYATILPDTVEFDEAATAEPLSVALHAVEQAEPRQGQTVVVIGLGIIGLYIVQILKSMHIQGVIAAGRRDKRLALANQAGASTVVDAAKADVVEAVERATSGRGADLVFEVAGTPESYEQGLQMLHRGGILELVGLYERPMNWNPSFAVSNDITLRGCGLHFKLPGAVDLFREGKTSAKGLITHEFSLKDAQLAFNTQLSAADAIKVIVKP